MSQHFEIQGRWLGIPYDWRLPTLKKIGGRLWNPGGPMLSPKSFGWGWTVNLAHAGSWAFFAGLFLLVVVLR